MPLRIIDPGYVNVNISTTCVIAAAFRNRLDAVNVTCTLDDSTWNDGDSIFSHVQYNTRSRNGCDISSIGNGTYWDMEA